VLRGCVGNFDASSWWLGSFGYADYSETLCDARIITGDFRGIYDCVSNLRRGSVTGARAGANRGESWGHDKVGRACGWEMGADRRVRRFELRFLPTCPMSKAM